MALATGVTIYNNRYRIDSLLGQGGFGAVYLAYDRSLKVTCALKENLDVSPQAQRQFEREAQLLAGLRHANLPRVIDYFTLLGQGQYLVMDFVDGEDLQEMLDRQAIPLPEAQAVGWIVQICEALAYLHSQVPPVIHRDIKPANIKITSQGRAMLVDFGIAKVYDPNSKTTIGARGVTPGYSPIEQYGQGVTDARTDLYALGATLYTLLTRVEPPESIARITGAALPPLRSLNPRLSPGVERATLTAMELLAPSRYQSAGDFKAALQAQSTLGFTPPARPSPLPFQQASYPTVPLGARPGRAGSSPASRFHTPGGLDWVLIPAGPFLYGDQKKTLALPAFEITRFPVTNAQYKAFLEANPRLRGPRHWPGRNFPPGTGRYPVVNVSLANAQAFCQWAGARLPGEEEWEKAARGTDGRVFPWGDQWADGKYCNSRELNLESTTPVDKYPDGVSPYGVWDLSGNVWEFTASLEGSQPVLRGGSWEFGAQNLRAAKRYLCKPATCDDCTGFRCAR